MSYAKTGRIIIAIIAAATALYVFGLIMSAMG